MSKVKLGELSFVTKLAGFEHTTHIQKNATSSKNEIPLIQGKNIRNGNVIYDFDWYISEEISNLLPRSVLDKKCIVVPYVGSKLGELAVFENDFKCHLASNVAKIELLNDILDLKYLYYYLKSPYGQLQLFKDIQGSAQPNITMTAIRNTEIKILDLSIQQKIASVLSALDDKIELNNKINMELEAMAKTLYDYWFVQFDFPNEECKPYKFSGGKMVYNEILKREIPEGWEVKTLKEISNITMGQSPAGESYNERAEGKIFFQGSTDFGWRYPENRVYTTEPSRLAKDGDILLSVRAPIGTMNIAMNDCCIGRGLSALSSKENYQSFLTYQMNYFKQKFDYLNSVGTTFGSLTKDQLYDLELVYPDDKLLKMFEAIVSKYDQKIKINVKQNRELAQLRDWLLPMLMNGQVKVTDYLEMSNEPLAMVAETALAYNSSAEKTTAWYDQRFELWVDQQGLAARGTLDKATLRELFDAMNDEDK